MVKQLIREQVKKRDGKCLDCGTTEDLSIDHIIPLSRGGINSPDNLRTLCGRCNRRKGSFISWPTWERVIMALHVDEIVERTKCELKGQISSNWSNTKRQIELECEKRTDKVRGEVNDVLVELRKKVDGQTQTIAFLTKKIAALEAHGKVRWVEETVTFEGYKKTTIK